ncbi:squalene cyclase [Microbacterium sp. zg.B48]|uniref:squalene cyclase n=1 Tax=Microbacterium sp. zg.B48 TaxID=2969408 RepID=UPI00214C2012|nr:squalene cyclase [Microbacterium sp. zg.B48]MCR2762179.1 squalene cyclase [Microbacterium sp. zg.B48]
MDVTSWLLDSDPVLRWQVERDLLDAPAETWQATRARIATEGNGAALLAHQDPDGQWAGGAFFPADRSDDEAGQPWTATTWTLTTLREWGLDAAALAGTAEKLARNSRWEYDDSPYWDGEVDVCINAMTLANGAWLGADVAGLAQWFPDHQLADGGWNCDWVDGSTRSSFHSTINALVALLEYEQRTGGTAQLRAARKRGEEYLLERRLRYRLTTGEEVGSWASTILYPFRAPFTALKAVDYVTRAARHDREPLDPRAAESLELVRSRRRRDGTWLQEDDIPGRMWFPLDVPPGQPSKWITFLALRALDETATDRLRAEPSGVA